MLRVTKKTNLRIKNVNDSPLRREKFAENMSNNFTIVTVVLRESRLCCVCASVFFGVCSGPWETPEMLFLSRLMRLYLLVFRARPLWFV